MSEDGFATFLSDELPEFNGLRGSFCFDSSKRNSWTADISSSNATTAAASSDYEEDEFEASFAGDSDNASEEEEDCDEIDEFADFSAYEDGFAILRSASDHVPSTVDEDCQDIFGRSCSSNHETSSRHARRSADQVIFYESGTDDEEEEEDDIVFNNLMVVAQTKRPEEPKQPIASSSSSRRRAGTSGVKKSRESQRSNGSPDLSTGEKKKKVSKPPRVSGSGTRSSSRDRKASSSKTSESKLSSPKRTSKRRVRVEQAADAIGSQSAHSRRLARSSHHRRVSSATQTNSDAISPKSRSERTGSRMVDRSNRSSRRASMTMTVDDKINSSGPSLRRTGTNGSDNGRSYSTRGSSASGTSATSASTATSSCATPRGDPRRRRAERASRGHTLLARNMQILDNTGNGVGHGKSKNETAALQKRRQRSSVILAAADGAMAAREI